ncbi:MAG: esterase-like activity of phytase family protein, partial [Akkermansiaceae bacterium]|nr:esterase-like activity of phytase family protein [Armatimonadota bacterium]
QAQLADYVNTITLSGSATDLAPGTAPNDNRLGGLFSDIYYDRDRDLYYGLPDRGPGGGLVAYDTRVQEFTLDVDDTTGAISNFNLLRTVQFTAGGAAFNGLNPRLLNGNPGTLGLSLDPEGFAVSRTGTFYVSDEYGPSIYEFNRDGELITSFTAPDNLLPRSDAAGNPLDFAAIRDSNPALISGRQDNRGFEGLAVSPDGSRLYAMLQDPLAEEGAGSQGRRSRNIRIVEYDTATRQSLRQFLYQLEPLADINGRIDGAANDFGMNAQGRNIGISAIIPVNDTEFLVLERDNRGFGVDELADNNPLSLLPVSTKRIYNVSIAGATDVSGISLAGTNDLPGGVTTVSKTPALDLQVALSGANVGIPALPEKFEGITIGRQLSDGTYSLLVGTDNDFSVTQSGAGEQFDLYYTLDANGQLATVERVVIGATPTNPNALLIPSYLFGFKTNTGQLTGFAPQVTTVPEAGTSLLMALGMLGLVGGAVTRRRK